MATNRYTRLSYSNLNDLPMLQLPFEALNNVVLKAQQSKDEFAQLSGLTPKYIQESETDRNLASSITTYQNQLTQQLTDLAASGNTSEYRRQLGNAKKAIVDMWKPGGAAYALEQRYSGWETEKKRIQEAMKDAPLVANFLQRSYKFNDIGYNPATREYKNLNPANFVRDVSEKEINEWFDKNHANIKDSLLQEGYSRKALEGVNTLHDFWQIKGVPYNRLVETFLNLFPEEYTQSIFQKEAAYQFFDPSRPAPETSIFETTKDKEGNIVPKKDASGNYVLNSNNPVAKLIQGQAMAGTRRDIVHDRKVVKNDIALERAKLRLKREDEEANYVPRESEVFNMPGGGVKPLELKIDDKGNIVRASGQSIGGMYQTLYPGSQVLSTTGNVSPPKEKAIDLFRNGTLAKQIPEAGQVYDKYKGEKWFQNLGDKEKAELLVEATNQAAKLTQTTNISANFPEGRNAEREIQNKTERIVGKGAALGDISNRTLYVISGNNVSSEPVTVNDVIKDYFKGDTEAFIKATRYKADVRGDNAIMPSGDFVDFSYKKGKNVKTVRLLVGQDNTVQSHIRTPLFIGNSVLNQAQDKSLPFETGIKELDDLYPKGVQTKRKTIYLDEDYNNMAERIIDDFERDGFYINPDTGEKVTNKLAVQGIVNRYRSEAENLRRSPSKNTARNEVWVLDYATGEEIGNEQFWRDLNARLESEAIKYEK